MLVDALNETRSPAFDHQRLATAINIAAASKYTALTLPFSPTRAAARPATPLTFLDNQKSIQVQLANFLWKGTLTDYVCTKGAAIRDDQTGPHPPHQ